MIRVRFAPSPTGLLHIGGARTALFNFLASRKEDAVFILRVDDTDKERSLVENETSILESLKWLGLNWDEGVGIEPEGPYAPYRQSERLAKHLALAEHLKSSSAAYIDDENCVRLRYPDEDIVVDDLICGECRFSPSSLGPDPVIIRSDGSPTYHLASVADDVEMGITHVIRGQDHLTNTAKHIVLFRALGAKVPAFAHLPLILGEDGSKLSKRNSTGFTTVPDFIAAGYLPEALCNFMCLLGWSHPEGKDIFNLEEAAQVFNFDRVSSTSAKFELTKLDWFNAQYIRALSPDELSEITLKWTGEWKPRIETRGLSWWKDSINDFKTDFERLTGVERVAELLLAEALECNEEASTHLAVEENRDAFRQVKILFLSALDNTVPEDGSDCYSKEEIKTIIKGVRKSVSIQPKLVFQSLRILMTGAIKGPELDVLLPHVPKQILKLRVESSQI